MNRHLFHSTFPPALRFAALAGGRWVSTRSPGSTGTALHEGDL
jgi:hypothetical protein